MTDLIPRDVAAAACDKHSYSSNLYVSKRMAEAAAEIRALPIIDPDLIREAALIEAADALRGLGYNTAVRTILALIGEKK